VHQDDVGQLRVVAQHAHDRGDAGAGGDEEGLGRALSRQDELACGLVELHDRARRRAVHEVVADLAAGDRLHRDGDAAVGPREVRGERVGPPLADAVDVDADPDVLAGDVARPAAAGPDHDRRGIPRLGEDRLDPAAQVGAGPEGVDQVEVVGGEQGRRHQLGELEHPVAQREPRPGRGRARNGCCHA
jgi:hypothetical protein